MQASSLICALTISEIVAAVMNDPYSFVIAGDTCVLLTGELPSVSAGIVDVQTCVVGLSGDPCHSSNSVRVKNCGDYRVYELTPTAGCAQAYCLSTIV